MALQHFHQIIRYQVKTRTKITEDQICEKKNSWTYEMKIVKRLSKNNINKEKIWSRPPIYVKRNAIFFLLHGKMLFVQFYK